MLASYMINTLDGVRQYYSLRDMTKASNFALNEQVFKKIILTFELADGK